MVKQRGEGQDKPFFFCFSNDTTSPRRVRNPAEIRLNSALAQKTGKNGAEMSKSEGFS
jgi:hypothetical protein